MRRRRRPPPSYAPHPSPAPHPRLPGPTAANRTRHPRHRNQIHHGRQPSHRRCHGKRSQDRQAHRRPEGQRLHPARRQQAAKDLHLRISEARHRTRASRAAALPRGSARPARRSQDHHHRALAQPDSVSRQAPDGAVLRLLEHGHPRAASRPGRRAEIHRHSDDRERT